MYKHLKLDISHRQCLIACHHWWNLGLLPVSKYFFYNRSQFFLLLTVLSYKLDRLNRNTHTTTWVSSVLLDNFQLQKVQNIRLGQNWSLWEPSSFRVTSVLWAFLTFGCIWKSFYNRVYPGALLAVQFIHPRVWSIIRSW